MKLPPSKARVKKVKAWAIMGKDSKKLWAAYIIRNVAASEINSANTGPLEVIIPCTITYTLPKKK